jgi:hypothetical protein
MTSKIYRNAREMRQFMKESTLDELEQKFFDQCYDAISDAASEGKPNVDLFIPEI